MNRNRLTGRELLNVIRDGSTRHLDVRLLVTPELAEAIELARKLGTLEAVPIPSDEGRAR